MLKLKHMITTVCPRGCPYCVTRNVHIDRIETNLEKIRQTYVALQEEGHFKLMITGGEPLCATNFCDVVRVARSHFDGLYLTTQNVDALKKPVVKEFVGHMFDAITFLLHDLTVLNEIKGIDMPCPVYASILDRQYHDWLPYLLYNKGFMGLTVNEDQRGLGRFELQLEAIPYFSQRVNRRGTCMDDIIILPNLDIITNFRPYL